MRSSCASAGPADDGGHAVPERLRVDGGVVAGDDAFPLQALHALGDCGRREVDAASELRHRQPGVGLELLDDSTVTLEHGRNRKRAAAAPAIERLQTPICLRSPLFNARAPDRIYAWPRPPRRQSRARSAARRSSRLHVLRRQRRLPLPRPRFRRAALRARARRSASPGCGSRPRRPSTPPGAVRAALPRGRPGRAAHRRRDGPRPRRDEPVLLRRHRPPAARHRRGDRVPAGRSRSPPLGARTGGTRSRSSLAVAGVYLLTEVRLAGEAVGFVFAFAERGAVRRLHRARPSRLPQPGARRPRRPRGRHARRGRGHHAARPARASRRRSLDPGCDRGRPRRRHRRRRSSQTSATSSRWRG